MGYGWKEAFQVNGTQYIITKPIQSGVNAGVWQLYAHTH